MPSYPTSVWDGDSDNQDSDSGIKSAPDHRDWSRAVAEVAAAQTQVDSNNAGVDSDTLDSVGIVATKTGLSGAEKGDGAIHKTVLTLAAVALASTDGTTPASDGAWGTQKLYTFPVGHVCILGAHMQFPLGLIAATTGGGTGFQDTADIGVGVGTVAAAQSGEFGLSTTEEDILAETDVDLTAKTSDAIESGTMSTVTTWDGTAGAKEVHLNFRTEADADHGATADILTFSGTVTIIWTMLGDD